MENVFQIFKDFLIGLSLCALTEFKQDFCESVVETIRV